MTVNVGLTGSIGMGKSTTARLFAEAGCAVWDADAAVHRLYAAGGLAVAPMAAAFPEAIENGAVSRAQLKEIIARDPGALRTIEQIVHPLVAQDRQHFRETAKAEVLIFDIPLLFEAGGAKEMDVIVVVSAPAALQQQRVMERGTMTLAQFEQIRAKQMPDAEKRAKADYVVITNTLDHAKAQVADILETLKKRAPYA